MIDYHAEDNGDIGKLLFYESGSEYAHSQDKIWFVFVVLNILNDSFTFVCISIQVIDCLYGDVFSLASFFKPLNCLVISCNLLALNDDDCIFSSDYFRNVKYGL